MHGKTPSDVASDMELMTRHFGSQLARYRMADLQN